MSEKSPLKTILKTSLPAVIDLSASTFMWTFEAILIGRIGAAQFAGHGMAVQIIIVVLTLLLTFIVGSSIIINRYIGANDRWEANHILSQALILGILMACGIAVLWYFGADIIFKLIREGDEARQAGITYLRTVAVFSPLVLTNFVALGIVRGAGETRAAMTINLSVVALNLVLAPVLIFGLLGFPRLEVKGAALAMCMSQSVGFFATLYLLRSRKAQLFLSFRELTTPNFKTFQRLFKAGIPTTVEQLVWAVGQLVVSGYAAVLGITVLAAHQVFLRIQSILSMFYLGFSIGAMTLVGKNLGADDRQGAFRTAFTANRVVFVFAFAVFLIMVLFAKPLIGIFTEETEVLELGSKVLIIFALVQIPKALDGVLIGNLRGVGDLKWLMWVTIASVVFLEVGLNWLLVFAFNYSLMALWTVHLSDEILRSIVNLFRFKSGNWKAVDM